MKIRPIFVVGALLGCLVGPITRVDAGEVQQLSGPARLEASQGALLLSLRSQARFSEKLHIWFLREGGSETEIGDVIEFTRRQAFGGPSMLKSIPRFYAVKPGKYILIGHMVGCDGLPPPGQSCVVAGGKGEQLPTARYSLPAPSFTIEPGKLTDAGEFVLEYPKGATSGQIVRDQAQAQIRWRGLPFRVVGAFSKMPAGPAPTIPAKFLSNIHCDTLHTGFLKPELLPFEC